MPFASTFRWLCTLLLIPLASAPLFCEFASAQTNPRTVVDYYLLMPDKHTYGVARKHRLELIREESGRLIAKDVNHGFLAISGDAGDPGITVALFKRPNGPQLIGVNVFNEMNNDLYFLQYDGRSWTNVTRSVIPGFNKAYDYELPRYGTTIKVSDKQGKRLYDPVWANGKFAVRR